MTYAYASSGDVRHVAVRWRNGVRDSVVFSFDGLGRRKQLVYSPTASWPVTVKMGYDENSNMVRLCSLQDGATGGVFRIRFAKTSVDLEDKVGYISTGDDAACSNVQYPGNETFAYDSRHQITQHNSTYYEYDASGNRTREILGGTNKVFEMEGYRNQLARSFYVGQQDTMAYTYDFNGSLIVEQGVGSPYAHRYYFYDSLNRISGVSDYGYPNRTGAPNTCHYDAMGVIRQPCEGGLGATTLMIGYDGPNTVRTGPDNSQTASWTFVHGPGVDDPLMAYFDGAPIYIYYVTDGAGRQYAVGENNGYPVSHFDYRHHRFAGGITRSETFSAERQAPSSSPGLSLFRNRMYDQATGRWTQEDPIGIAGGINLYQYAGNNPASYTDPFGLCPPEKTGKPCGLGEGLRLFGSNFLAGFGAMPGDQDTGPGWLAGARVGVLLGGVGRVGRGVSLAARDVGSTARAIRLAEEFLGKGAKLKINDAGDAIFVSEDGLRRLRFDINRPYPHQSPHGHIDEFINGEWTTRRIYPTDVPHR